MLLVNFTKQKLEQVVRFRDKCIFRPIYEKFLVPYAIERLLYRDGELPVHELNNLSPLVVAVPQMTPELLLLLSV